MAIIRRFVGGDPKSLAMKADGLNLLAEGAARALQQGTMPPLPDGLREGTSIRIYNDTGLDLDSFAVVEIGTPYITPSDNLVDFLRKPCAMGIVPTSDAARVAIIYGAMPYDQRSVGKAYVSGMCPVQLLVLSSTHTYAKPISGLTDALQTTDSGPYEILYVDTASSTSGSSSAGPYVWGWVRYCGTAATLGGYTTQEIEVVTDVQCIDGFIQATYETVRVLA